MRKTVCLAALAALILISSSFAFQGKADLLKRVTLDMNATPAQGAFDSLARSLGCELALDAKVQQPVTIRLENVTARTALDAVCESIGCRWRLESGKLIVEPPGGGQMIAAVKPAYGKVTVERFRKPLPAGMRFENAPLGTVLQAISAASEIDIQMEGADLSKTVTLDLSGKTFIDALKSLTEATGFEGAVMIAGFDKAADKKFRIYIKPGNKAVVKKAPAKTT